MNYKKPLLFTLFCVIWSSILIFLTGITLQGFKFLHNQVFNIDTIIGIFIHGLIAYGFILILINLVPSKK